MSHRLKCFLVYLAVVFLNTLSEAKAVHHSAPPFLNLLEYRDELRRARGHFDENCPMNLRVRSSFKLLILEQSHNFDWLLGEDQYSDHQKRIDSVWGHRLTAANFSEISKIERRIGVTQIDQSPWNHFSDQNLKKLNSIAFYPGFYDPNEFVSFQIGPAQMPWWKDRGYNFKVFFEFKDPQSSLTPEIYRAFARRLSREGFQGDFKIPVISGWIRFNWNNVVVHATSLESARIAEKVGLQTFEGRLSSYSRGIDFRQPEDFKVYDWPSFLCLKDPALLPADIYKFVNHLD